MNAFTLAEVLVTLTILGIIAAITVPGVVKRHIETSNRAKIKKAVATYDALMNKIVVENNIKSAQALEDWAAEDCSNTASYFKVSKNLGEENSCTFRTTDGVYWDITDITSPIISLNEEDLTAESASDLNNKNAFALASDFDENGILRVDDNVYFQSNGDEAEQAAMTKLWGFVNKGKSSGETANPCEGKDDIFKLHCDINNNTVQACNDDFSNGPCQVEVIDEFTKTVYLYGEGAEGEDDYLIEQRWGVDEDGNYIKEYEHIDVNGGTRFYYMDGRMSRVRRYEDGQEVCDVAFSSDGSYTVGYANSNFPGAKMRCIGAYEDYPTDFGY